jgi:LytR cell envelope-related transcriptional attenuator
MNGKSLPAPGSVTVSVLNGTGVTNQAAHTGLGLAALGFHVGTLGDSAPVGTPAETVVTYSSAANEAAAEMVSRSLAGMVIMERGPTTGGSQVTVTTGTDFSVVAAPSTATGTSPTTSAPAPSSLVSLTPPSPTVSPLKAWDPRACTASGGEGQ